MAIKRIDFKSYWSITSVVLLKLPSAEDTYVIDYKINLESSFKNVGDNWIYN